MTSAHAHDVGAFVLGALPEDDRERFSAHLAECEACRREVAELQMVADTLPLAAPQVAPPPELKDRIMAIVRAEAYARQATHPAVDAPARPPAEPPPKRSRWPRVDWSRPLLGLRPIPAALAAALLIAAGVAGGVVLSGGADETRVVTAQVRIPGAPAARASLAIAEDRTALRVRSFPAPPRGRIWQVWLKRPGRPPDSTDALFTVRDGRATVPVPGDLDGVAQVLVTHEPRGGSRRPTRRPVVIASLA